MTTQTSPGLQDADSLDRAVPVWLVSTSRSSRRHVTRGAVPYGMQHARQVGSPLTACGLTAIDWEIFWSVEFPDSDHSTCTDCVRVVQSADVTHPSACPECAAAAEQSTSFGPHK